MEIAIQDKKWDSEFFGFKVGALIGIADEARLLNSIARAKNEGYTLLYWSTNSDENNALSIADRLKFFHADTKIFYTIAPKTKNSQFEIKRIGEQPSDQLIKLAIASGAYSRFNIDQNFPKGSFEKLYTLWIKKSMSREMADEVFAIEDENNLVGFVTFIKRKTTAEIGLIGVDASYRKQGYGKNLINFIMDLAFKLECTELTVVTQTINEAACKLYESCGFSIQKKEFTFHIWLNG